MKITALSQQTTNPDRVNVMIDGKYRFSLDFMQITDLNVKVGRELDEMELAHLEEESLFGKLYGRALEYSLLRPRSVRELKDYLYRKTRATKYKTRQGEIKEREGFSVSVTERVLARLIEKGYVDDEKFAEFWVQNRHQRRGASQKKLRQELQQKGVERTIIEQVLDNVERDDSSEIAKVLHKKYHRYPERDKLIAYLLRQGFSFDDIKTGIAAHEAEQLTNLD